MERFIKKFKEKEASLEKSYISSELENIEKITSDLEREHQQIIQDIDDVDYLLSLIEKHQIKTVTDPEKARNHDKGWVTKIKNAFEKYHLMHPEKLSSSDIEFLQNEKYKLELEKKHLETEHHHIHGLIAKTRSYAMNVMDNVCKDLSGGQTVTELGQKLLDHFGKKINHVSSYDSGKKEIIKFLEETFSVNKISSKKIFDILKKSKVIYFQLDVSNVMIYPPYENFTEFTTTDYVPIFGAWFINA